MIRTGAGALRRPRRSRLARRRRLAGMVLSLPAVVLVALLLWTPIVQAIRYSMTSWNGYSAPVWIGPSAYTSALTDPLVQRVLENNALLLLAVPFFVGFGGFMFVYALTLQDGAHFSPLKTGVSLVPMAVAFLTVSLSTGVLPPL